MIVDGEALVHRLTRQARSMGARRTVIVVSPLNASAVTDVIESNLTATRYVVQPRAAGPGEALFRALEVCTEDHVLVLLGDNIILDEDLKKFDCCDPVAVGSRTFHKGDEEMVEKLTRIRPSGEFVEKVPVSEADLWPDGSYHTWYGPLLIDRKRTLDAFDYMFNFWNPDDESSGELYIGPYIASMGTHVTRIEVDAHDVGYR